MADFTFVFVDMGQGDCTLVQCPDGKVVVVDCGSKNQTQVNLLSWPSAVSLLRSWTSGRGNKVEALILTHPDSDHYNKVINLFSASNITEFTTSSGKHIKLRESSSAGLSKLSIGTIYFSNSLVDTSGKRSPLGNYTAEGMNNAVYANRFDTPTIYEVCNSVAEGAGVAAGRNILREWSKDDAFTSEIVTPARLAANKITANSVPVVAGNTDGQAWAVSILAGNVPYGYDRSDTSTLENAGSLITLFTIGTSKVLLCGDATLSTEKFLLEAHAAAIGDLNLLMVPHHGSDAASSQAFVDATNPAAAVVSVGFQEHSHCLPRYSILTRWLEKIDREGRTPVAPHDIDYWVQSASPEDTDRQTIAQIQAAWADTRVTPSTNFSYTSAPASSSYIATYVYLGSTRKMYRENVDLNMTMTSQATQVYKLSHKGLELVSLPQ